MERNLSCSILLINGLFLASLCSSRYANSVHAFNLESNNLHRSNIIDKQSVPSPSISTRRKIFSSGGAAILSTLIVAGGQVEKTNAFPNKISDKYDDRPKRKGPKPKDLGVSTRKDMAGEEYTGLKECGPAPNCFCSTDNVLDDPEHNIPSWKWPKSFGGDTKRAFSELEQVISAYKPGQSNIDGGGFQIVTSDLDKGYIYVQFEALKAGYIDDLEVALIQGYDEGVVQVRSSSRVGYLDFGVNAKRINFIAKALSEKGWDAPGVDFANHQDYAIQNSVA